MSTSASKEEQRKLKERERSREYRRRHPERAKANVARYRNKHKAEINERVRLRRKNDPEQRHKLWNSTPKAIFSSIKRGAEKRKLEFNLDLTTVSNLIKQKCFWCGINAEPKNGIDRVDNNLGYVSGNVVTSCTTCNKAKLDQSVDEWYEWIDRIATFQGYVKK